MKRIKVLVLATSKNSKGGIAAVVNAYAGTSFWKKWNCYWLGTHKDGKKLTIVLYFLKSFIHYFYLLPQYQIIHIHLSEKSSALRKSIFFIPAYFLRKKIVLHFHAADMETTIDGPFKRIYRFLFKRANSVIVLSEIWKKKIETSLGSGIPLTVVYNPCGETLYPVNKDPSKRSSHILFAGTLNERKGFKDLIHAFVPIAKFNPSWKLIFAGNGDIESGKELVKKMDIDSQVLFKGWVSGMEKHEVFSSAAIFCLPSYAEGFPMSVLDAMAYSIPVITTPTGGILDIFSDNKDLLIFQPGDIKSLSRKMELLIHDFNLRSNLANNALLMIDKYFRITQLAAKIETIYISLIHSKMK